MTQEADVAALVKRAVDEFGRLDCAVNNAGITGGGGAIQDLALEQWSRTLAINLTGVFLCLKHELAVMRAQKSGAIVNMSSGAGVIAVPGLAAYCASKHGVLGLTKTAAVENARSGVRVNAILPGSTDTPMLQAAMGSDPKLRKIIESSSPAGRLGLARGDRRGGGLAVLRPRFVRERRVDARRRGFGREVASGLSQETP